MQAFRTRGSVLLTIATGAAAILSFGDQVHTGDAFTARFVSFWLGVAGYCVSALCVLALYQPVRWWENPGGQPKLDERHSRTWSLVFGRYPEPQLSEPTHPTPAARAVNSSSFSLADLLTQWDDFHRKNYAHNNHTIVAMGHLTRLAIVGVALLVIAWLYNGYGISDTPAVPERIIVVLEE